MIFSGINTDYRVSYPRNGSLVIAINTEYDFDVGFSGNRLLITGIDIDYEWSIEANKGDIADEYYLEKCMMFVSKGSGKLVIMFINPEELE